MKILITGGTGLIGKALVCELALSNNDITVLSRSPQKVYSHFCNEITCWTQLSDKQNLNGFDAVINLAGEPIADNRWTPAQKHKLINSRCDLTQKLVELIKASDSPLLFSYLVLRLAFMVTKVICKSLNRRQQTLSLHMSFVLSGSVLLLKHKHH